MKKILKWITIPLISIVLIGGLGFLIWSQITYKPTETLSLKLNGKYTATKDWYTFGDSSYSKGGVILYPGAKVDPLAYGEIAYALGEQGYFVVIPNMTLNFAIFDKDVAKDIQQAYPNINKWAIGGHSLGGVAAAMYAQEKDNNIDGIFFLASYPSDSNDFSKDNRPMLSISGEKDGLSTPNKIEASKKLLPPHTTYVEIKGGNHAQFGVYGKQSGDNHATISVEEQQKEIEHILLTWLDDSVLK